MARASEQDLEAALTVSRIIEELEKGYMPGDDNAEETEFFDQDDPAHCKRALDAILIAARQGSIFRVAFGMAVVLDPRNKVLDPDADTLELHPDLVRKGALVAAPAAGDARMPVLNIEAAAKTMAECMDYPWAHMPEQGRATMREHAQTVIRAASQQQEG